MIPRPPKDHPYIAAIALFTALGAGGAPVGAEMPAVQVGPTGIVPAEWVLGVKRVLAIRIRFPDQPDVDPISEAELATGYDRALAQLPAYSFGHLGLAPQMTITPRVTMPHPTTYYAGKIFSEELMADARAAAAALGAPYDSRDCHLDVVVSNVPSDPPGASAVVGGKGVYVTRGAAKIQAIAHELGHNLALPHGTSTLYGNATFGPLVTGTLVDYGDDHDLMGDTQSTGGSPEYHFNPAEKYVLGWLPDAHVERPVVSGTYRIHAFDQPSLVAGQRYALRLPHSSLEDLWLGFRQQWPANPWTSNGLELFLWNPSIHYLGFSLTSNTIRLDPTPGSPGPAGDVEDAALVIGRTLHDAFSDLHVTPVGKGGTVPESMDVVVNFGPFPGNVAPVSSLNASSQSVAVGAPVTVSATATDGNGDALAYAWDFGDGTFDAGNAAVAMKSWSAPGEYTVACIVSDMKGGESRKSLVVTVGAPVAGSIAGTVRDELGNPMRGVHVHNGLNTSAALYRGTYTRDDGSYVISNLAAGSYSVTAGKERLTFDRSGGWNNPVVLGASQDVAGKDFQKVGGATSITGRVRSGPAAAFTPGITVRVSRSDGATVDVVSNGAGTWQLAVPQGITRAEVIAPAGWSTGGIYPAHGAFGPNPWTVDVGGAAIAGLDFYLRTPDLPPVGFDEAASTVFENAGAAGIPVSVTRSVGTNLYMLARIVAGGTATGGGVDHFMANAQFVFPAVAPGPLVTQTRDIVVPVVDDQVPEPNETVLMDVVATQVIYAPAITTHALTIVDADMTLSPGSVAENQPPGTVAGTFATGNPDLSSIFSYALVPGSGGTDNGSFSITGRTLRTAVVFDHETKSSYAIRVRCTDAHGGSFEEAMLVTVLDLNDGPGRVPDGSGPGVPLTVRKSPGDPSKLDFSWGASCGGDVVDYGIYQGTLGAFTSHLPLQCTTGGTSAGGLAPDAGNVYFLVVPRGTAAEGSYGLRTGGSEIPPSATPCIATQDLTSCP